MQTKTYPPGTLIANRYQIAVPIGAGGMGMVYYAFDHGRDGLPIALKTFRPHLLSDRSARDMFLQEGRAWLELGRHPHIVELYAISRIEGRGEVFIAAELISPVEGKRNASLRQWIHPDGMAWEQALLFGLQIVWGMQHAVRIHPDMVHRDLKPENVLVGADKVKELDAHRVRVTDFGLVAGLAKGDNAQVGAGTEEKLVLSSSVYGAGIAGTPSYMAPEQWLGEGLDERTDIYAWGLILAELLSGKMVVQGDTASELKQQHLEGVSLSVPEHLPAKLRSLVEQCVSRDKASRPEGWEVLERELREVWQAQKGESLPEGGWREAEDGTASQERRMRAYNTIGMSYTDIGQYEDALAHFEKSLTIARQLGDRAGEGRALGNMGNVYQSTGQYERALAYYEQTLAITRERGDRAGEGLSLGNLGSVYQSIGQYERALAQYEQALAIARELGDRAGEGVSLGNLGIVYQNTGQYERALAYYEKALAIARELGDRAGEGRALGNLGNVYENTGQYERALAHYEQALAIARELGDRAGEGHALGNMGNVYQITGQNERALAHYEQRLAITRELGDQGGVGRALGNLGNMYRNIGNYELALEQYEQALRIARELGDQASEGRVLSNLGNLYQSADKDERARNYYEQALAIARALGDVSGSAIATFNIAVLTAQVGDLPAALSHALEAQRTFARVGQSQYAQQAAVLITRIEQAIQQK